MTITSSMISGNSAVHAGGGIRNHNKAELTIPNSTISDNTAKWGGGGANVGGALLTITDSIISNNSAEASGGIEEAQKAVEANPDDLSLHIPLADALAAAGQYQAALEVCLNVIHLDKTGAGVQAKETMLNILNLLDDDSDVASAYRRKLATALY